MAWYLVKHGDNFTFTMTSCINVCAKEGEREFKIKVGCLKDTFHIFLDCCVTHTHTAGCDLYAEVSDSNLGRFSNYPDMSSVFRRSLHATFVQKLRRLVSNPYTFIVMITFPSRWPLYFFFFFVFWLRIKSWSSGLWGRMYVRLSWIGLG